MSSLSATKVKQNINIYIYIRFQANQVIWVQFHDSNGRFPKLGYPFSSLFSPSQDWPITWTTRCSSPFDHHSQQNLFVVELLQTIATPKKRLHSNIIYTITILKYSDESYACLFFASCYTDFAFTSLCCEHSTKNRILFPKGKNQPPDRCKKDADPTFKYI